MFSLLLNGFYLKSHDLGLVRKLRQCSILNKDFEITDYVIIPHQSNLSKTGKHLSSFLSHCNMEKEHELLKKAGVRPTMEPPCAMHKIVEQQDIDMDKVLGKYHKFMDSHAYSYGYNRSVSTNLTICTLTKDKKLQLLSSLSSLESRVELFCNKCFLKSSKCTKCVRCKTQKTQDKIEIMADSSASDCFTHTQSNLSEFEVLDNNELVVKTASKTNSLKTQGRGVWMIMHEVTHRGKKQTITSHLYPVYYLPGLSHRLMSVGHLLNNGLELRGSSSSLTFSAATPELFPMI